MYCTEQMQLAVSEHDNHSRACLFAYFSLEMYRRTVYLCVYLAHAAGNRLGSV